MNCLFPSISTAAIRARRSIAPKYLGLFAFTAVCTAAPALGAERIYVTYGPLEVSVPIESLTLFAKEGKIDSNLDGFAQYAKKSQLAEIRNGLQAKAEISPVTIAQFLYTPQGEVLLERLGRVIQTKARQPGFYAIRAALILAASDPEGMTILNVLRKFPTYGIRIDIARGLGIANELTSLINRSNRTIAGVAKLSETQAAEESGIPPAEMLQIQEKGPYNWKKSSVTLTSPNRDRTFDIDIYLPLKSPQPAPVVVISHGLGSDRISYEYLAKHLASYGFAVAVPEHPGSNAQQIQDLVTGRANEVAEPAEFVNRPLDIKDLLDYLTQLSTTNPAYRGQLDLQRVGVIGQSFGGYTALTLAGAEINFAQLDKDCKLENETWNLSLLLQCRARSLDRNQYNFGDPRVKAAIAINPIVSSILGETNLSKIQIPVMVIAGTADTVAPALLEQIQPFTWLTSPNKYLVLMNNGTHFSTIDQSPQSVFLPPAQAIGPEPALARRYLNGLSLAFMESYLNNKSKFRPYLEPNYALGISRNTLGLRILRSLTPQQLQQFSSAPPPRSPAPAPAIAPVAPPSPVAPPRVAPVPR
ncbi:MAG: alpha/beta hydrolase [Microcoleus sp. PH2017_39_LGB_O_B]|uniref:alpha/beta hydrolase n=1 Tax=unclassified Microcoleus TaxID=2642155 RepID=UPI001D4618D3|nr:MULTISPECIES: alpha/beta hydrolase [unclassified Microcoleus]TAG55585.1 MAG: alpha/beta hydrolase [Oscillatoriales cyanobacterium]MCC3448132.1 alpha/beta hydrolase [Microcoleus sp. PH2017_09_SFU_O_A]MCC3567290.1 alpha/beta hydrolase [Microcoleus sp. PH2017_31_RDM_U_A]MCC3582082.1 alpha/beta hydrolase [Microcoleus sp. PH2017_32_RDM_D_A]MCC3596409.1 alpha/beta hydrolase [Microcoleus sp. PH2017_26_ELK_O_A]